MASNQIPTGINDVLRLASECQAGAVSIGAGIPLLINTASEIGSARGNLFQLEGAYQVTLGQLKTARGALLTARSNGVAGARATRKWLEHTYGPRFNQDWRAVGFIHNTLAIPSGDTDLAALLERMAAHLGTNPSLENPDPKVNVSAARAGALAAALTAAIHALNGREQESVTNKSARDGSKKAMRKRLAGLVSELNQRLSEDDGRWRRFGLNLPSAPTVPATPSNVQVNTNTPEEFFITCAPSANATHYRLFTMRAGVDEEPVFAGNSDEPMFHLTGLTPGQSYQIFVTAANTGAESRLSKPVTAVVSAAEEAAA
jgi:hypothetical protein